MTIGLIVECSVNGVIGVDGKIPWYYPEISKRFDKLTSRCSIIMGRKTWDNLQEKPPSNRTNIVVTSEPPIVFSEREKNKAWAKSSIEEALDLAKFLEPKRDIWFIGGKRIFEECIKYCNIMDFTYVPLFIRADKIIRIDEIKIEESNEWYVPSGVQKHPYNEKLTFKRYARKKKWN